MTLLPPHIYYFLLFPSLIVVFLALYYAAYVGLQLFIHN